MLYLSRFVLPALYVGSQRLYNENMSGGGDRIEYLEGLVTHLNALLDRGDSVDKVREFLGHVPFAGLVECYVAALPFFRNTLLSDVLYTAALFGGWALLRSAMRRPATESVRG